MTTSQPSHKTFVTAVYIYHNLTGLTEDEIKKVGNNHEEISKILSKRNRFGNVNFLETYKLFDKEL